MCLSVTILSMLLYLAERPPEVSTLHDDSVTLDSESDQLPAEQPEVAPVFIAEAQTPPTAPVSDQVFTLSPQFYNYGVVGVLALIIGLALGGFLFGGGGGISEEALRIAVREELAQQLSQVQLNTGPVDFMADNDPFLGPADAPVTVVEFSDFLCQYCGRHYEQTLRPLLEEYDGLIKYVYRDYPGVGGQYAVTSALAAECANDQGKFWDYHNILFENSSSLASDNLENILIGFAGELSLDVPTFTTCLQSRQHQDDIVLDRTDGLGRGVSGTPGFFINGRFLSGAQPIDTFRALINDELAKQGITPPGGSDS